jgi:hypothetical protein
MNAHNGLSSLNDISFASSDSAFREGLSLDTVRNRAPAVFASAAHECLSPKYGFISTRQVLEALMNVGFVPMEATQTRTRRASPLHGRHVVRLRRQFETIALTDSVPEVVFLNSHDGTCAYQLRIGIYRPICTNGLITSRGAFPAICVAHRGNVVDQVVEGALALAERFDALAGQVELMQARRLDGHDQLLFAEGVLALRYPGAAETGMAPSQLLRCRRVEDGGSDLWSVLNRCQENLLRGGLNRRSSQGRLVRTRGITAIRRNLSLNEQIWDLASQRTSA